MRQAAKQEKAVNVIRQQHWHEGGHGDDDSYAFEGYDNGFWLYTSDRRIKISDDGKTLVTGKPARGYGLEIETECNSITDNNVLANVIAKIIFPLFPSKLFKQQRDGSLHGKSASECITQPMTKEAIRNSYSAFKAMYNELFPSFDISCSASGNCGMHVNISCACFGTTETAQEEAIRKLYYIINKHYTLFCNLLNRSESRTNYCAQMDYSSARTMNLHSFYSSHGVCFNLGHYDHGRIELRLVGGQKNFPAFRNTMETVFHLVERVKKLSWKQCDDVAAIFRGCNQYVYDRVRSNGYRRGHVTEEALASIAASMIEEDLI